jgi:glutathionylspermidine synthase
VLEFSYIQWEWLQDRYKDGTYDPEIIDQNNEIYTNLVEMFKKYKGKKMMFTCLREQINAVLEYETTCLYLAEVASHAGVKAFFRFVDDLVIDQYTGQIVDEQHGVPDAIFKLYPTEWFLNDLIQQKCEDPVKFFEANNFIEQPYKLLMGGKYLLPELYRLFGETNGLIKAWHTREECIDKKVVAKSYYGRIGFQVEVLEPGQQTTLEDRVIYQEYVETQRYGDDNCKVTIGSFVIGGVASGIGIRSQTADVTTDNCYAVPHVVYKD